VITDIISNPDDNILQYPDHTTNTKTMSTTLGINDDDDDDDDADDGRRPPY